MTNPYAFLERYTQWAPAAVTPDPDHPGKLKKVTVNRAGHHVSAVDPANWMTRAEALSAGQAHHSFVLAAVPGAESAIICFDFDGCFDAARQPSQDLRDVMAQLGPNVLWEVSVSGTGVHGWCWGRVPPHSKKNTAKRMEAYSDLRHIVIGTHWCGSMDAPCDGIAAVLARYFPPAATGEVNWDDSYRHPDWVGEPLADDEVVRLCGAIKSPARVFGSKATFQELMAAEPQTLARHFPSSTDAFDRSSADLALFSDLAWATGHNAAQMVRIARASGLARDKWDREDYMASTVARGVTGTGCYKARPSGALERAALDQPPTGGASAAVVAEGRRDEEEDPVYMPEPRVIAGGAFATREVQLKLFAGHCYVLDQHKILTPRGMLVRPDQFRALHGGSMFLLGGETNKKTSNAWEAFTENQDIAFPRSESTCFRPEHPFGSIVPEDGVRRVNTYLAPLVRKVAGDAGPLLRHLKILLPDGEDAQMFLSYLAACVQYPGRKFPWAPVLQGVEGNGKTLFSIATAYAVGRRYTHWPNAQKLNARFNGWMVGKVLYCVEDIYMPGVQGEAILEGMKPMITGGRGIEIEGKNADQVSADICGNFLINTNHKDGVRKTANDRRYGMFYCAQQEAVDLARDFGNVEAYMRDLYKWLDNRDGLAIFAHHLSTMEIPERFDPTKLAQRAPRTSSHDVALQAGMGMIEQLVLEAVDEGKTGFKGGWISSTFLKILLEASGKDRFLTPDKRKQMMKTIGFLPHPSMKHGRVLNSVAIDGGCPILYVRAGSAQCMPGASPAEIAKAYAAAQA